MRYVLRMVCLLAALMVAGCVTERVVWSPDGTRAVVIGDDGLHVCDLTGKLSPVLIGNVSCVQWLPDSKRVVACEQRPLKTWNEAQKAFPEEAAAAEKNAEAVRTELTAATGEWSKFVEGTKKKLNLSNVQLVLAVMAVRDRVSEPLKLPFDKRGQDEYAAQMILEDLATVNQIDEQSANAGATLYRHACVAGSGIKSVRISPQGDAAILSIDVRKGTDSEPVQLLVVATNGSGKNRELGRGARYPDWSPDGKYVVYIAPVEWSAAGNSHAMLGMLTRQQVAGSKGLITEGAEAKRDDLAGLLFNELSRVRVAKDGRIFFSAAELTLPVAVKDVDSQLAVFCLEPGKQSTLTRVVPRGAARAMGDAAQYFELSPDARYVSIPSGNGRVSVLDVATGEAEVVQAEVEGSEDQLRLATVPVWRTATELTFLRPVKNSAVRELVRYSVPDKSEIVLSADWPKEASKWLVVEASSNPQQAAPVVPDAK